MSHETRQAVRDILAVARAHRAGLSAAAKGLQVVDRAPAQVRDTPATRPGPATPATRFDLMLEDWRNWDMSS